VISGALEVEIVLAPLAAPVVLLLLQTQIVITTNGNYQLLLWHRHTNPLFRSFLCYKHNTINKRTNNDLQDIAQETKDRATPIAL